jgi:aryl-alcohol dehydrogenase-like predicted oxidoreductase
MQYKLFGRGTGLRVTELALGAGLFGTRWGYGAEPDEARKIFDAYLDAGGNFIDTADSYEFGQSEELLGGFLDGRREDVVLATKVTLGAAAQPTILGVGNSRLNLVRSVEASLRRLRTDRIDLLWVHMPDTVTSTDEIMRALDDLVRSGKVLYIGLSDFPAWRVSRAATLAELRGWAPVIGLQTEYSLVERTPDRELLPMANAFGLGVVAWSPLGGGLLTGKYRRGEEGRANTFQRLIHQEDQQQKVATVDAVLAVAEEAGATPIQVALSWIMSKGIVPILGPRNAEQLAGNLSVLNFNLTSEHAARLDEASAVALGFPHDTLAEPGTVSRLAGGNPEVVEKPLVPVA